MPCSPTSQPAAVSFRIASRDILSPIASGAQRGRRTIRFASRLAAERNHKKGRMQALFQSPGNDHRIHAKNLSPGPGERTVASRPLPSFSAHLVRTSARERVFATNQRSRDIRSRTSCDPICAGGSQDGQRRASGRPRIDNRPEPVVSRLSETPLPVIKSLRNAMCSSSVGRLAFERVDPPSAACGPH